MSNGTKFFQRFSLEQKILAGFGLALATLIAVGAVQYRATQALIETDREVAHTHAVLAELEGVFGDMEAAESSGRGYVATGDYRFVRPRDVSISICQAHLLALRKLFAGDSRRQGDLDRLASVAERKVAFIQRVIEVRRDQGLPAAIRLMRDGEGVRLMTEIRGLIEGMEAEENGSLQARQAASRGSARNSDAATVLGILLALIFGIVAAWVTHRDIVQRQLAEASRARLAAIVESSDDAIIGKTLDGIIQSWNAGAERLYGYSAEEVKGRPASILLPPDRPDEVQSLLNSIRKGESIDHHETVRARKDGRLVQVSLTVSPIRDVAGKIVGASTIARDITERQQAEEALIRDAKELAQSVESLRQQTELLQSILRSMGDGVIVADEKGKFLNWNPAAEQILGLGAMDVPIDRLTEKYGFYLPDKITPYPASQVPLARAVRGEVANKEEMFVRNDVRPAGVWVSATGTPLRDQAGVTCGGVVVLSEITERKQAEEALIRDAREIRLLNQELEHRVMQRTAELEAINKELETFTYSVAHDLRAPLRHIDGFSKMLEEETEALPDEAKRFVKRIRDGTRQMGQLVDDLLNLARLGRKDLSLHVTGLNTLAEEAADELKKENAGRSIEWKIANLPFVECDPGLMKQVFVNLLSNAVKYTRPRSEARIEVGAFSQDGRPVIFVRDNGVGFSMKYADKLFGVFQRLHRSEDFEGTGIGLATVQRILHRHGGRAWAEAELDKGATFYFTLGAERAEGSRQEADGSLERAA
ncbi:MAG: PAS domain S-box protein [Terriglobia bacterium]